MREPRLPVPVLRNARGVNRARLVEQRSRAPASKVAAGATTAAASGCRAAAKALFEYQGVRPQPLPAPGGRIITCESRNYQQDFCYSARRSWARRWCASVRGRPACRDATGAGARTASGCRAAARRTSRSRPRIGRDPCRGGAGQLVCESREYAVQRLPDRPDPQRADRAPDFAGALHPGTDLGHRRATASGSIGAARPSSGSSLDDVAARRNSGIAQSNFALTLAPSLPPS